MFDTAVVGDAGEERGRRMQQAATKWRIDYTTTRGNGGASVAVEPPTIPVERTNHTGQKDVIDLRLELRLKETDRL